MHLQVETSIDALRAGLAQLPDDEQTEMRPVLDLLLADATIPASTSNSKHGAFEGGLIVHTYRVWSLLHTLVDRASMQLNMWDDLPAPYVMDGPALAGQVASMTAGAVFRVALIHDLNKVRDLKGQPYYVPNILKSLKRSTEKPWKTSDTAGAFGNLKEAVMRINAQAAGPVFDHGFVTLLSDDGIQIREGLISLALAIQASPALESRINAVERNAIIYHDGAYAGRTGLSEHETVLQILLHAADMIASKFVC